MRALTLVLASIFLAACGSDMQVTTTLNSTKDIRSGDDVFLSGAVVAEVVEVEQVDSKTVLTLELNNNGESSIKQNAAVVVNRLKANTPLEIYNQKDQSELIQAGDELQGLNSMFQLGAWMVGDSLNAGSDSLSNYVDAFQRYLNGDEFKKDKQAMTDAAQQLGQEVRGAAKTFENKVKNTVTELGVTEQKAAEVVEQLGTELAPVLGELSKSSQAVVKELDELAKNLKSQSSETKELGSTLLSSLLKTLERVNDDLGQTKDVDPVKPVGPGSAPSSDPDSVDTKPN